MGYLILVGIFAVLLMVGLYVSRVMSNSSDKDDQKFAPLAKKVSIIGFAIILAIATAFSSYNQISVGHVGIVYTFGSITGQISEGPNFIAPWSSTEEANVRTRSMSMPALACFSSETQQVSVDVVINYSVSANNIQNLYRTVGANYEDVIMKPRIGQIFKDLTVKYTSTEIAPNREAIRAAAQERIDRECEPYSIQISDVLLADINFEPAFEQAIEQKQVATQNALEEEQKVQVARHQANQKIETAKGEGQSTLEKALKQAEANRELSASLTANIIAWEAIQKLNPNVEVMIMPAGQNMILPAELFKK